MEGDLEVPDAGAMAASAKSDLSQLDDQAKLDTLEKKAVHLRVVLEKDYKAADLKWSLFVAAAHSYRYDTCLRPFPPEFIRNGSKDMDELISIIGEVPALDLFLQKLDNVENLIAMTHVIELLFWVLVRLKEPSLKSIPLEAHDSILQKVNSVSPAAKPQHIFQVVSSSKVAAEMKWQELAKNQRTFYAYHGSRLENFHSIMVFGLQQHLNKNMVFGNGIYLTSELSVSLPYSHSGFGWGASCLGGNLSCLALCEVVDAPEGINYQKPAPTGGEINADESKWKERCSRTSGSVSSELPQSYYIVTNNDLVRVRYLLVYAKPSGSVRERFATATNDDGGLRHWFGRHKLFSILLGYGVMLATVGFANNQPVQFYCRMLLKKLDVAINSIKV